MRDRAWLRSFLHLDARDVPLRDVERQEDTVLRALDLLDAQPGLILADEVGMGKTYEALGVIAARHHDDPARRTLVLTPGPDLNTKWRKEFAAFCDRGRTMYRPFDGVFGAATNLRELLKVTGAPDLRIAIAPVTMFAGSRATRDQSYLVSLFFQWKGVRGNQAAAALRRHRQGLLSRIDVTTQAFLDEIDWARIEPVLDTVMTGGPGGRRAQIDEAYDADGYGFFERHDQLHRALAELRFRLVRELLPPFDLLVIDEAHKLKNAGSLRATAVRDAFAGKFERALFLTATPFQLDVSELRDILSLFALARTGGESVRREADALFAEIRAYQDTCTAFETAWRRIDETTAAEFNRLYESDNDLTTDVEDPALRVVVSHARQLLERKRTRIEPAFRRWMIRSLREDKREYRRHDRRKLTASGGDAVPFLVYERFIAELFRSRNRTHKAAVQINMVSSFGAAREGAILNDDIKANLSPEAEAYRLLLRDILEACRDEPGRHPKLHFVVKDALDAAEHGDKTLIFCTRIHTLQELRRQINDAWLDRLVDRWKRVDPAATRESIFDVHDDERTRGRHSRLQVRFQRTQDALHLALRERYLQTAIDIGDFGLANLETITRSANATLAEQRVAGTRAERFDWALAKRCVEHAAAIEWRDRGTPPTDEREALEILTDPRFVHYGYDREPDDLEPDETGDRSSSWTIGTDEAELILSPRPHLWAYLKSMLVDVPGDARVRAVERLARYLTKREVPFLADVMTAAKEAGLDPDEVSSRDLLLVVDQFWTTPAGRPWRQLLWDFLAHLTKLDTARRHELLEGAIAAGEFVRHTEHAESRERLRESFNTPLYPMVLVANEVMQEGLDLHLQCARVIHHDLAWNPAQLEQRVGRVDRLGSLLHRRRQKNEDTYLDILHPLVDQTIDMRLDRTVRAREKWLEVLLGQPGSESKYDLTTRELPIPPLAFTSNLRIELGPLLQNQRVFSKMVGAV